MPLIPILLILGGGATLLVMALSGGSDEPPVHEPDLSSAPQGQTRYKLVNAILPQLRQAAQSSGIPLGVLVGWIAKESGGKLSEVTKYGEAGLFQIMPSEGKTIGVDMARLSTDLVYSINAGLALIGHYMGIVDKLDVASEGSDYFWKLVKLAHSMGGGAVAKIVAAAKEAGDAGNWHDLESYAEANNDALLHATKHSPSKWFPFVDEVASLGAPFGFGTSTTTMVGGAAFKDIVDPLDCLLKA